MAVEFSQVLASIRPDSATTFTVSVPADWLQGRVRAGTAGYLSQTSVPCGVDGHAYSVNHQTVAVFG